MKDTKMKVVVLGASGRTGKVLIRQTLTRGHLVTAVVRNADKITPAKNLTVVTADVTSAADLTRVFRGHDAVLSTLGNNNAKLKLIERSTRAIIPAMQKNDINRFITELSFGAAKHVRFSSIVKGLTRLAIGKMLLDQATGAAILEESKIDWTVVFAVALTNGALTKQMRVFKDNERVGLRNKISRNDVAYFMLEALENHTFIRQEPVITG